ncbi:MAG: AraC family ligand binding domain-containing protein [Clostridia bacterium]
MDKLKIEEGNCIADQENSAVLYEIMGLTAPIHSEKCSLAVTRLEGKGLIKQHYHLISEEIYVITQGSATMKVNEKEFVVCKGETIVIYPKEIHELYTAENETIEFYAITLPPFTAEDFIN